MALMWLSERQINSYGTDVALRKADQQLWYLCGFHKGRSTAMALMWLSERQINSYGTDVAFRKADQQLWH